VRPSAVVSEGAEGTAAQTYCGEIVKPKKPIDERVEPTKISDNTREGKNFLDEKLAFSDLFISVITPCGICYFKIYWDNNPTNMVTEIRKCSIKIKLKTQ
jgi:hypothetical protein